MIPPPQIQPGTGAHARVFALVGNPNSGKTTLFNALTGMRQKVGNYPGVTVERKEGTCFSQHGEEYLVIDLPGAYSLNARSPDEEILRDVLLGCRDDTPIPDAIICIIDSTNLERNLYFASQILELGRPTIIVLNMMDLATAREIELDAAKLSELLGVPVIPMQAHHRIGLPELRIAMSRDDLKPSGHRVPLPAELEAALAQEADQDRANLYLPGKYPQQRHPADSKWEERLITARYDAIQKICDASKREIDPGHVTSTDRLDKFFLHPIFGWAAFAAILGTLFFLIFKYAEIPMGWIDALFATLSGWVTNSMPPGDLRDLITDGIIAGVGGVIIFLPQILILFFFIGLMEDTGYMSRVAFLMDRVMKSVGLNGKSFVPLLSSHACAVPSIMGTRTIENPRERLITILVAPFAGCTARLPVYLLMIAVLVPTDRVPAASKAFLLVGLYGLGIIGIIAFAALFNRVLKREKSSAPIMELPSYKAPSLHAIFLHLWERSKIFIRRAGTIILGISIILWALQTYPKSDSDDPPSKAPGVSPGKSAKPSNPPSNLSAMTGASASASSLPSPPARSSSAPWP